MPRSPLTKADRARLKRAMQKDHFQNMINGLTPTRRYAYDMHETEAFICDFAARLLASGTPREVLMRRFAKQPSP